MAGIEDLLRQRREALERIDAQIADGFARAVTLLFTDIVGSTEFFETAGDIAGRQMIQTHNDLLFPLIQTHGGRIIKTIGDSIMASFEDPGRACACAVAMQERLREYNGGRAAQERIRVRMGLHHGQAVMEEKDLFGDMVNTAARVESRADGEEILISGSLKQALEAGQPAPLVFLGSETVKGKKQKIDFYLVNWDGREDAEVQASWSGRKTPTAAAAAPVLGAAPGYGAGAAPSTAGKGPSRRVVIRELPPLRAPVEPPPGTGNPYLNRVMLPSAGMFFGREAQVRRIMGRLSAERPQSVSIVGERRIGKSSLLNHLASPATRLALQPDAERYLYLFLDFQQLRTIGETEFLGLIFAGLRRQLGEGSELEVGEDFDGLRALAEGVAAAGLRLVLLADEFESVTKNERLGAELYSFLRSLANNYPFFLQMACSAWFEYLEDEGRAAAELAGQAPPREVLALFREESEPHFEYVLETLPAEEKQALADVLAGKTPEPGPVETLLRKGYLRSLADGDCAPFSEEFGRFAGRFLKR
jgi:class 3 adenylate cyclase